MTSWYGLGTALQELKTQYPQRFAVLKTALQSDPFLRYVFTNVDTSLAATDETTMKLYAGLVTDEQIRTHFLNIFLTELQLIRTLLQELLEKNFQQRRINHYYSNLLRAGIMEDLHQRQVDLLKKWRAEKTGADPDAAQTQLELMLTVNALASATGSTG